MTFLFWVVLAAALIPVAELLVRVWLRRRGRYYVFPPGLRLRLQPDPDVFPELESVVRFEINSEGERGREVPPVRAGKTLYRVLVVGGSQPEGYLLDQQTCWPGALQDLLQTSDHRRRLGASSVHVGSIARSGVGSEALDLVLERVLPRYPRLDLIIVLVGASDILRWLEQGAPDAPSAPPRVPEVFMCHPEGPFGWKPDALAITEVLRRARRRWLRPVQVHSPAGRWIGTARAMRNRAIDIRSTTAEPAPMLDHFEECLGRLVVRAHEHADRVLVIEQPWFREPFTAEEAAHMWHGGIGQAWLGELTSYYSFDVVSRLMTLLNARVERVTTRLGVEHLELMSTVEGSLKMYYDGFHATPAGSAVIVDAIAETVLRQTPGISESSWQEKAQDDGQSWVA